MDLYALGPDFSRLEVLDNFDSLIWTERYSEHGDFTLNMKESTYIRSNLRSYKYLESSNSNRIMMVETIERPKQELGYDAIQVKGRSIEAFLKLRSNKTYGSNVPITITGKPSYMMHWFVERYCINPATTAPENVISNLLSVDTNLGVAFTAALERGSMYDIVKKIADATGMGFMMHYDPLQVKIIFQAIQGIDRSDPTSSLFREYSPDAETLTNPSRLESISNYKNHAKVIGAKTEAHAYSPGISSTVSGWNRRTLIVEARDIGSDDTTTVAQDQAALVVRGQAALAESNNKYIRLVDGDIATQNWNASYFGMGDIVMVEDSDGAKSKMRITEDIWSLDQNGELRTPTFTEYVP